MINYFFSVMMIILRYYDLLRRNLSLRIFRVCMYHMFKMRVVVSVRGDSTHTQRFGSQTPTGTYHDKYANTHTIDIRVYLCMFACMHVCMYVYLYVCMFVCLYVCLHVCM